MKFFEAIGNVFRIPDLRRRVFFTLGLLAVYRLGGHIPTPELISIAGRISFSATRAPSLASSICLPAATSGG
jgi:preprotein translocase subunit SecY